MISLAKTAEARETYPASTLMTGVTSRCAIDVAVYAPMVVVRIPLVVRIGARMTIDAGERRVVRRDQVAVRTDRAIVWNAEPSVIKGRAQPAGSDPRSMAGQASGRVQRGNVVRHSAAKRLRAQPGRVMAPIAIRTRRSKAEWVGAHVA
jgi:hypothetical protein